MPLAVAGALFLRWHAEIGPCARQFHTLQLYVTLGQWEDGFGQWPESTEALQKHHLLIVA